MKVTKTVTEEKTFNIRYRMVQLYPKTNTYCESGYVFEDYMEALIKCNKANKKHSFYPHEVVHCIMEENDDSAN